IRELFGTYESPSSPSVDTLVQSIKISLARVERESGKRIAELWVCGKPQLRNHLAVQTNRVVHSLDFSDYVELDAAVGVEDEDLLWLLGLLAAEREKSPRTPLVNFRRGPFEYKPLWRNFVAAFKEEALWVGLAVVFGLAWIGTVLYSDQARLAELENGIETQAQELFPGETLPEGQEVSILTDRIARIEEQLRGLGSLSSLSPLDSLKELSTLITPDIDIQVEAMNIGHSGVSFRGSVRDIPSIGRLNAVLESRQDRFCRVQVNSRGREPRTSRVNFQAEIEYCS
ncbi:MAG: hypothetical protein KDD44_11865, partial [Bdellovibrionales bacterium]|nr:hypothetical protein [Bdellovibrionales bacterium]